MIRRLDGHPATAKDRARRQYKVSVGRVRERVPKAPRTAIVLCVVCRKAYPLHSHDTLVCARQLGLDGNAVYVMEHALVHMCAGRCGAIVSNEGALCLPCAVGR